MDKGIEIKFGTEGWRGVISSEFTFENVSRVVQAICSHFKNTGKPITIGYDNRFLSERFAALAAGIFSRNGFKAYLSDSSITTPNLCYNTKTNGSQLGIMITASHNPAKFNGLKMKAAYGGPVPDSLNKEIEKEVLSVSEIVYTREAVIKQVSDLKPPYIEYLKKQVDFVAIRKLKSNVVFDCMHGPSGKYIRSLFKDNPDIMLIREQRDPMFGGINPEPIEKNMLLLQKTVVKNRALAGFALDGDGDRVGVVDNNGKYLPPHLVFPLLLYYLVKYKHKTGKVVQAISLGYLSKRIAQKYNLEFEEVPVGFKHVTEKMIKEDILIGGEESSGYAATPELPDRDGILSSLIILEMLPITGQKLSAIVSEIEKEFGESIFLRRDVHLKKIIYNKELFVKELINSIPERLNNKKVIELKTFDGIKIILDDDSWLLMRPSGTEPILRVYSETTSTKTTTKLLQFGESIVEALLEKTNFN